MASSKRTPGLDLRNANEAHKRAHPLCSGTMYFTGIDRGFHTFRCTSSHDDHDVVWHPANERR